MPGEASDELLEPDAFGWEPPVATRAEEMRVPRASPASTNLAAVAGWAHVRDWRL